MRFAAVAAVVRSLYPDGWAWKAEIVVSTSYGIALGLRCPCGLALFPVIAT